MRYSVGSCLLLLAACGGPAASSAPTAPGNEGGAVPTRSTDTSLTGPFERLQDWPEFPTAWEDADPVRVTALGRAEGPVTVSLVEVRATDAAASCLVTIETPEGVYAGDDFLCSAFRSDETVNTAQVSVSIDGATATVRFRTSYQLEQGTPDVGNYTITCSLESVLSCTPPPAIGGYD